MIKKIAILTSGGDAPGMNTVIKAVVNSAINKDIEPFIIFNGYKGLYNNEIKAVNRADVKDIGERPGTFIYSERFPEFANSPLQKTAIENLVQLEIDALIVIGGDGSYKGADQLSKLGIQTIGIPGTIDNDIAFNDFTVGFPTALDTIVNAIDQIRDTSESHARVGVVEIMGRYCGSLALRAALATNAEVLSIPERKLTEDEIVSEVKKAREKGNRGIIVLITEHMYDAWGLAKKIEEETEIVSKATVLGYSQRGGKPSTLERINAYKLGSFAIKELIENKTAIAVSIYNNKLISTDIDTVVNNKNKISKEDLEAYLTTK